MRSDGGANGPQDMPAAEADRIAIFMRLRQEHPEHDRETCFRMTIDELRAEREGSDAGASPPWCGAARELGGQQPCPINVPCAEGSCAIGGTIGARDRELQHKRHYGVPSAMDSDEEIITWSERDIARQNHE